jgi:hypothetical protein
VLRGDGTGHLGKQMVRRRGTRLRLPRVWIGRKWTRMNANVFAESMERLQARRWGEVGCLRNGEGVRRVLALECLMATDTDLKGQ